MIHLITFSSIALLLVIVNIWFLRKNKRYAETLFDLEQSNSRAMNHNERMLIEIKRELFTNIQAWNKLQQVINLSHDVIMNKVENKEIIIEKDFEKLNKLVMFNRTHLEQSFQKSFNQSSDHYGHQLSTIHGLDKSGNMYLTSHGVN